MLDSVLVCVLSSHSRGRNLLYEELTSLFLQYVRSSMTGTVPLALGYLIISEMERQRVCIHKAHYCAVDLSTE